MWTFPNDDIPQTMIEVSCAIIVEKGRVLATQRSMNMPHPLKWEFPGGKLKQGESHGECIVREIREELGLEVNPGKVLSPVIHHYEEQSVQLIPVVCTIIEGVITLSEHQAYQWVACEALENMDWLEADLGVVALIRMLLCSGSDQ